LARENILPWAYSDCRRSSCRPGKVETVSNWQQPANVSEIRSFLGLAGYYWRFIEGFSKIARPMTELLKKEKKFNWTEA
jgi:hypothetical protein